MNSFGAYSASVATFRVPLALTVAGTCAAIAALAVVGAVEVVDVEVELELLLEPQPASASITSAGTPARATNLLIEIS